MKTVNDFNFENKKALIRVDFNVPLSDNLEVADSTRILAAKSTIIKVLEDGGSCVLMSHLGRPNGVEEKFSLKNIAYKVSEIIGVQVQFSENCIGEKAEQAIAELENGEVLLLENLRFHKEEKAGDDEFAKELSKLGDIYVNDAFGTAHRAHASTAIIAKYFPKNKCYGLLLASEIENIHKVLTDSKKPVTAIIGGAKVSSKITIIESILDKIDHLIIGGGMAFTFIKAQGGSIGSSLVEDDKQEMALSILKLGKEKNVKIHLPVDAIIADQFSNDAYTKTEVINAIPEGWMGLDVGSKTNTIFREVILNSNTILWNGPAGYFENPNFANGSIEIAKKITENNKSNKIYSVAGGGDTVSLLNSLNSINNFNFVSTAGGAFLEYLEGKELPGIKALN